MCGPTIVFDWSQINLIYNTIQFKLKLNRVVPILNNEQWAGIGAKTKIIWEEQLLDPSNNYITSVIVFLYELATLQLTRPYNTHL